jgi:GT2 family glycosyltransferase
MKVDLVIDYYKALATLPHVVHGLNFNKYHINTLIIVNDDIWDPEEKAKVEELIAPLNLPTLLLEHTRNGFGSHHCTKLGIEAATTEYVVYLNSDVFILPGALELMLKEVKPERITYGAAHTIPWDTPKEDLYHVVPLKRDIRWLVDNGEVIYIPSHPEARCWIGRDIFVCVHKPSYFAIGGHDLTYPGYGFIDYDLAARWMIQFGLLSTHMSEAVSYHLDGNKKAHSWDEENKRKWDKKYQEYLEKVV